MFDQQNPDTVETDTDPHAEAQKRNSGRTGPTSEAGKFTAARNATRHGMCSTTLIMSGEVEADWLELLQTWLEAYQSPAESSLLYTFILKTAQAEWHRLRVQREYDFHLFGHGTPPIGAWRPDEIKTHDLILRYLTAAERRFQREYRMLEQHWKSHHNPKNTAKQPDPEPAEKQMPRVRYINNDTGESVDAQGNQYPPPPDWKPIPIIPGVYPPNHPANWQPEKPAREKRTDRQRR